MILARLSTNAGGNIAALSLNVQNTLYIIGRANSSSRGDIRFAGTFETVDCIFVEQKYNEVNNLENNKV